MAYDDDFVEFFPDNFGMVLFVNINVELSEHLVVFDNDVTRLSVSVFASHNDILEYLARH